MLAQPFLHKFNSSSEHINRYVSRIYADVYLKSEKIKGKNEGIIAIKQLNHAVTRKEISYYKFLNPWHIFILLCYMFKYIQNMTQNYIMNSIFDIAQKSTKQWDCFWEESYTISSWSKVVRKLSAKKFKDVICGQTSQIMCIMICSI